VPRTHCTIDATQTGPHATRCYSRVVESAGVRCVVWKAADLPVPVPSSNRPSRFSISCLMLPAALPPSFPRRTAVGIERLEMPPPLSSPAQPARETVCRRLLQTTAEVSMFAIALWQRTGTRHTSCKRGFEQERGRAARRRQRTARMPAARHPENRSAKACASNTSIGQWQEVYGRQHLSAEAKQRRAAKTACFGSRRQARRYIAISH